MAEKDSELVRRTLEGDTDAFGTLVKRYVKLVHGVIFEAVRRPEEVDDLSQDVFCKAYLELTNLREHAKFAPWLARMAGNTSTDWLRSQQVRRRPQLEGVVREGVLEAILPPPQREKRADQEMIQKEDFAVLMEALERVKPEYRRVLILFHIEGCSYDQICRFLGLSFATVKMRLYKGKKLLREEFEALQGQPGKAD